ncbi:MAG: sulfatase-like hydrolase/transferase [Planctomycetota bacterium]
MEPAPRVDDSPLPEATAAPEEAGVEASQAPPEQAPTGVRAAQLLSVVLLAGTLVLPKLTVLSFVNERLFMHTGPGTVLLLTLQDALLVGLVACGLWALARRASLRSWALVGLGLGALLALLLIDARARELWLRPLDLGLVRYFWANLDDLQSGNRLFFTHQAGWGLTFRKILVVVGALYAVAWGASALALFGLARGAPPRAPSGRRGRVLVGAALTVAFVGACCVGRQRYRLEENLVLGPAVGFVRGLFTSRAALLELAARHDQPARPLREVLGAGERRLLVDAPPLRNVLILVQESLRWDSVGLEPDQPSLTPTLRELAGGGLTARCYVCLPHSSKAYYAILTGRHPFPGIEMHESLAARSPSLFWLTREQRGAHTSVLSSAYLAFENTEGLLEAAGAELLQESPPAPEGGNSFGKSDALLYAMVPEVLRQAPRPFTCCVINLGAHYPYDYPGKASDADDGLSAYEAAVRESDRLLASFMRRLDEAGVLEDTLVVLVGDHGESFGEHGAFVHNTSLYDEEVTVPLIFWTQDGRLKHDEVLRAQQIDILPTVADLLGIEDGAQPVQGRSLLRARGPAPIYLTTFFEGVGQALVEGSTKYYHEPDGGLLVAYDLERDPEEQVPRTPTPAERERVLARLRAFAAYQRVAFEDAPRQDQAAR